MHKTLPFLLAGCAASTPGTPTSPSPCDGPDATTIRGEVHLDDLPAAPRVALLAGGAVRLTWGDPVARGWSVPTYDLVDATVQRVDGGADVCGPGVRVHVGADGLVEVFDAEGSVLAQRPTPGAPPDGPPRVGEDLTTSWTLSPTGPLYGLGEQVGGLDLRGRRRTLWNTDAYDTTFGGFGPEADPLYLSVPLVLGLHEDGRAWGLFTDHTVRQEVDLGATDPQRLTVRTHDRGTVAVVLPGPSLSDVVRRYTALTGRHPLPPRWSLGYHQCRWGYAPDSRLIELADTFRELALPADTLWLDIQHMDGFRSFTFDPVTFPDPEGLAAALEARDFRLVTIQDPGLKVDPGWDVYDEALAGGHLLRRPDGRVFEGNAWPGVSAFPDMSRDATRRWWGGLVGDIASRGVDGIWLDVNEPTTFPEGGGGNTIDDDVRVDGDGTPTTMAELHNAYALLQADATRRGLAGALPGRRPFVLTRAGWAGTQRHAAVWTGDVPSTWWGLRDSLPMLLNLGLSGLPVVGSDVGGYSGSPGPELFARWMALGVVSPFFRGHVTQGTPDQEPWAHGIEVTDISRAHLQLRTRLLPLLYSLLREAEATGAPPLRPMVWHFQDDPDQWRVDDQAMLGPWLLVAPVLTEGATSRSVRLPAGTWLEWRSGAAFEGPGIVQVDVTLAALPMFLRPGAVLVLGPTLPFADAEPDGPHQILLHPTDGTTGFTWYEDAGDGEAGDAHATWALSLTGASDGATLTGSRSGSLATDRTLEVVFRGVHGEVSGVALDDTPLPRVDGPEALAPGASGWWHDVEDRAVKARLPEPRADFRVRATYARLPPPTIDTVTVPVRVRVPPYTPRDAIVHVASDVDGWVHHPLERDGDAFVGTLRVPRGRWYLYKFTRGDWCTVEKYPGCVEAEDRYAFGAADAPRDDTVWAWRDACPDACP